MTSLLVQQRFYESRFDAELNSRPPFGIVNIHVAKTHNALLGSYSQPISWYWQLMDTKIFKNNLKTSFKLPQKK